MKKTGLLVGVVVLSMLATEANAQLRLGSRHANAASSNRTPVYSGTDAEGMTLTAYEGRVGFPRALKMAPHNPYSPEPVYTYSKRGLQAGRMHTESQNIAAGQPWHGNYMNWRWREPTALVVPPTPRTKQVTPGESVKFEAHRFTINSVDRVRGHSRWRRGGLLTHSLPAVEHRAIWNLSCPRHPGKEKDTRAIVLMTTAHAVASE